MAFVVGCSDDGVPSTPEGTTSEPETSGSPTSPTTGISDSATTSGATTGEPETGTTGMATTAEPGSSSSVAESESSGGTTGPGECRLLLAEALYDAEAGDDQLQWVKLYNPCDMTFDLTMFSLGYGGADYTNTLQLELSVSAGGCFVVGGPMSSDANGNPNLQQLLDFAPDLDLATATGGGIALFDVPAASVEADTVPIDAVVYGPNNDNGLIGPDGMPVAAPHVGNAPAGGSIRRTDFDAVWETAAEPTPSECPPF